MANLSNEQRRALRTLAGSPNGCTEALMLAQGFQLATLGDLMLGGFAWLRLETHSLSCG
jgi:hypothetical protein